MHKQHGKGKFPQSVRQIPEAGGQPSTTEVQEGGSIQHNTRDAHWNVRDIINKSEL